MHVRIRQSYFITSRRNKRGVWQFLQRALGACAVLLLLAGCESAEKTQARSQLSDLNGQRQSLQQTIVSEQSEVRDLQQQLKDQDAQLAEYQTQVEGYMLDHKMALTAIVAGVAGAGVALDSSNAFSEDAKNMGGVVTFVAALWALGNLDEISDVVKTLNEADAHVRTLRAGMERTRSAIEGRHADLVAKQSQLAELGQQIATLNARIDRM
jgi:peptidoglycan hydrolase CwlO-like protein